MNRGAVGFVVGGFEHQGDAQLSAHRFVMTRHLEGEVARFEHIHTTDQHERRVVSETDGAQRNAACGHGLKLRWIEA